MCAEVTVAALPEGLRSKVEPRGGCWIWTGQITRDGYGRHYTRGVEDWRRKKAHLAHRFVYEMLVGPIPGGLQLDHLCRVRSCVRPSHVEPVTGRVNVLRGETIVAANAAKTHCLHGHEFDAENTYLPERGGRECRTCRAESEARRPPRAR